MIYALYGFLAAVFAVLLLFLIWQLAKVKLERWSYDLNRETLNHLREGQRKLDSIERGQERLLTQLARMNRTASTLTTS
jgi:hypothetical protein